ncbi:putative beta-lactamase-like 1 [Nematostella vectensis]|uniref:putative beta-lactamase-like 1 n=1 Tax=Nematostella vectensis TaxID=45351 RepID=UPI002076FED7|nr:putative beta-lactamase-like 1 [Nematostella vectensis]
MEPLDPLAVRFRRSTRTWQIIASVSCVVAVVIAILFASMCYSKSSCKNYKSCEQQKRSPLDSRCPGKPPLFALPKPLPSRIDEALDKIDKHLLSIAAKAQNKSAISINIFYRDAVVWKGHYGSKIYKGSVPPDDNTKYRIGSVTKIFAVLLLFKLREDGLISSQDDPLSKYASEFSIKNPFTNAQITLWVQARKQESHREDSSDCPLSGESKN